ncbi:MAG: hypothetical protein LUG16_07415 [Candidatus Gastranaerophilales bacterium]|nr:hypothetical protein [Candidatus Gastranaerophilales bacterium]
MKNFNRKYIILILSLILFANPVIADNIKTADKLMRKAHTVSSLEESYNYVIKARKIYEEEVEINSSNINALVGLSKTYQYTKNREDAKLYVLMAYNLKPYEPSLQKEMGDFYFNFQEYSTAIEYYKLALSSGYLKDFETNLKSAQCYEKLGDEENAQLYYKISGHVNPDSRQVKNKLNEYSSQHHADNTKELENAKYKYLFKDKKLSEEEQTERDVDKIIEQINI